MNHDLNPNCKLVCIESTTKVFVFSVRKIASGVQLTVNYGESAWGFHHTQATPRASNDKDDNGDKDDAKGKRFQPKRKCKQIPVSVRK
jgi:SET domain-containing protein